MADERTRWVSSGEVDIAYRTLGGVEEPAMDIVFVTGIISHIEVLLEEPGVRRFFDRLGRGARVTVYDRRGTGMSGAPAGAWSLEDEVADLEAVLNAVGADRVVFFAYAQGGPLALAFAALHPERTLALILYAPMVASLVHDTVPWALSESERLAVRARLIEEWGTGANLPRIAPSAAGDERVARWLGRLERSSFSPSQMVRVSDVVSAYEVLGLLEQIRVPTLALHRTDDALIDVRHSRLIADRIPGARLVELAGDDNLPMFGDAEAVTGEIEAFLTGGRRGADLDRELLTVLFTDVVDATDIAARIGDSRWRDLLAEHDAVVRSELQRYGGTEVKTIGDAFLATFAGRPSQAVRCARAIVDAVRPLGIAIRCGMHTGECEHIGTDVGGMAVHIAARVSALAAAGEVLVSGTVYGTVVGSGLSFSDRGSQALKGVPGQWPLFVLDG